MNAIRNKECYEFPEVCFLCGNCNKHHNTEDGAEKCCTSKVSKKMWLPSLFSPERSLAPYSPLIFEKEMKEPQSKPKTDKQRGALHVGCKELADYLNAHGLDMRVVLAKMISIPWTGLTVKEYLYKPVLKAYANKKSTEEMNKSEPGEVWDILMKHLGETQHVEYMPWPSKTVISEEQDYKNEGNKLASTVEYPDEKLEVTAF